MASTIMGCADHKLFKSQREADDELGKIALHGMRKGGRTWRLLKVFPCGAHWHVGRDWKSSKTILQPVDSKPTKTS